MGVFKQHSLLNFTINVVAKQCTPGYPYKIYTKYTIGSKNHRSVCWKYKSSANPTPEFNDFCTEVTLANNGLVKSFMRNLIFDH